MELRSFTPAGKRLLESCSEVVEFLFANEHHGDSQGELVIVTPQVLRGDSYTESSDGVPWDEIHQAWEEIQSHDSGMAPSAWQTIRQYGQEIAPSLEIFCLRDCEIPRCFCLLPEEEDFVRSIDRLVGLLLVLSVWRHIMQNRGFFHAAGITREGLAYMFAGPSGAGKSTVVNLSSVGHGYRAIHDDHVVVRPTQAGKYLVTNQSLSIPGVPLKSVFFLVQDTKNQLIPLSPLVVGKRLLKNSFDVNGHHVLFGTALRKAFATSAAIARSIPGYELRFRKSPDFWDVIDAELGNGSKS